MVGDVGTDRWSYAGRDIGWAGAERLEFVFGDAGVESLSFDGTDLTPDDPRLDWFALAGTTSDGGPYPPEFEHSPFDGRRLSPPSSPSVAFDAPFGFGSGFAEVVGGDALPLRAPDGLRSKGPLRTVYFAKAHSDFFACGATPVLHAVSDGGVVEWFSAEDLTRKAPDDPIVGHEYGPPLGRPAPHHRGGIAAGVVGFATIADDRPIWVRATPFGPDRQIRDAGPAEAALGAPIRSAAGFLWPVLHDGRVRMATRGDAVEATWAFAEVADLDEPVALAPPCRLEGGLAAWVGEDGYLIGHAAEWRWHRWPEGFRAATRHRPHLDLQGGAWQFGTGPSGYAFAKLSSGRQDLAPTTGHHVEGVRFTVQGTDFLDRPAHDDRRRRTVRAIDGKLAVPVLNFADGAVVALSTLPAEAAPEDYFSDGGGPLTTFGYRFLSFADLGLTDLGAGMMNWAHRRDLQAFVFAGRLFLTSRWETRCVVLSA